MLIPEPESRSAAATSPGLWFVAALTLLAAAVRFWIAPHFAFDGDEFWTLKWTRRPYLELLTTYHTGLTMHLYLVFMKAWIGLTGTSPFWVKLPTVIAGIVLVPLTYRFGKRWTGAEAAAIAAGLVALSGPLADSARTARVYPILAGAVLWAMACFVRAAQTGDRAAFVRLAAANALTLILSLNSTIVLLVQGVTLLAELPRRPDLRSIRALLPFAVAWAVSLGLAGAFYLGTIGDILRTSSSATGPVFHPEMLVNSFVINHPAVPAVIAALVSIGGVAAWRSGTTAGRLLVIWTVVPALFYFAQRLRYPDWAIARYLLVHAPAQLLLAGWAVAAIGRVRLGRVPAGGRAAAAIVLFAAAVLLSPDARSFALKQPRPSNPALETIAGLYREGDFVTHDFPPFEWLIDLEPGVHSEPLHRVLDLDERPRGRLIALTFAQPAARTAWERDFDVYAIEGPAYRHSLYVLCARESGAFHSSLRAFLNGLVAAADAGADLDLTAARHFGKLEEIHGMLETLAREDGDGSAAAEHGRLREEYGERSRAEWRSVL